MKQFLNLAPITLAGFTFVVTFTVALTNGATLSTSILRSILSLSIVFIVSFSCLFFVKIKVLNELEKSNKKNQIKKQTSENQGETSFKDGYQDITGEVINNSQIQRDITKLLETDPMRAAELLKKMGN